MGLLDKMNQLESEIKPSEQGESPKSESTPSSATSSDSTKVEVDSKESKKKVPQLKMGAGKKKATTPKKPATNSKFKNFGEGVKKPDGLANAKKTTQSSLHTHLNKTDKDGVSHKDRIEQELQAQVKKIKKIMIISIATLIALVVAVLLIMKIVDWASSETPSKSIPKTSYYQLKASATKYAHSKKFDPKKFETVFDKFCKQATTVDKAKAIKLKAKLLKEHAISK